MKQIHIKKARLFREMNKILEQNKFQVTKMSSSWYKFIVETYHIGNDYFHYAYVFRFNYL